jgi:hypothetical protein
MKRRTFIQGMIGAVVVTAPVVAIINKLPLPVAKVVVEAAAPFNPALIPLVRRVMPSLIASQIVGVQPMSGPVGEVFNIAYSYEHDYVPRNTTGCWGDYII